MQAKREVVAIGSSTYAVPETYARRVCNGFAQLSEFNAYSQKQRGLLLLIYGHFKAREVSPFSLALETVASATVTQINTLSCASRMTAATRRNLFPCFRRRARSTLFLQRLQFEHQCAKTIPVLDSVTAVGGTTGIPEVGNLLSGGGFSNYVSQNIHYCANIALTGVDV